MAGRDSVRFIALSIEFDATQGPAFGCKAGSIDSDVASIQRRGESQVRSIRRGCAASRRLQWRICYNVG